MPTRPLTDEECVEALRVYREAGSYNGGARALSMDRMSFKRRVREAEVRGLHLSPGLRDAVQTVRAAPGEVALAWVREQREDGGFASVMLKPSAVPSEQIAETIRGVFEEPLPTPPVVTPPEQVAGSLCAVFPVMDAHLGMYAWPAETGDQDYNLSLAVEDFRAACAKVDALMPRSALAILLIGGDFTHGDDETAQTPQNKHPLDIDSRYLKILRTGRALLEWRVVDLLERHEHVHLRLMRGNHDPHAHLAFYLALESRYRDEPRVTVEDPARDIFWHEWGRCLIAAHHGDKIPPRRLHELIADECPFWSSTRHRFCFVGHGHHAAQHEIGGLQWEMLRPFAPRDAYSARMGFTQRRALHALAFHRSDGLVLRAQDPIQRAA